MNVRALLVKTHLWLGLIAAPVLLVVGATGALLVVEAPIVDRLDAGTALVTPGGERHSLADMLASVQKTRPDVSLLGVQLPQDRVHSVALTVSAGPEKGAETILVDPYTARVLGVQSDQHTFFRSVRQLHRQLLLGRGGNAVVVWGAVVLGLIAITGPLVWWPRRRVGVRWERDGWRRLLDVHALLGAISCAFLLLFAITGAVVHWDSAVQSLLASVTGNAAPRPPTKIGTTSCAPSAMLDADRVLAAGTALLPGARATSLQMLDADRLVGAPAAVLPGARTTALQRVASAPVARLAFKYPEDRTPGGRSILLIDRCTGRAGFTLSTRAAPVSYLYPREWNRELHTGDIFGWPSLVLAFVFSLGLCVMGVTGPIVWLMKIRDSRSRARSRA